MRGAVVLVENSRVALIERVRAGRTYYLFPGGGAEPGETPEGAAAREAWEELGVRVRLGPLAARVEFQGAVQYYYLAEMAGGTFGTGSGAELASSRESVEGSYRPVWRELAALEQYDIRPKAVAHALARGTLRADGSVLVIRE